MLEPGFQSFKDLVVWQRSMQLAADCYQLTRTFPRDELFGMTAQIRRSASSIAANKPALVQCDEIGKMLRALIRAIQRKAADVQDK